MVDWSAVIGELLTQILRILLPLCVAIIIRWAVELYLKIKEEQPNIIPLLDYFVEQAVYAAEQIYGSGHGETKKEYALQIIQGWLEEYGLNVDVKIISDAIEAQVYQSFHELKEGEE